MGGGRSAGRARQLVDVNEHHDAGGAHSRIQRFVGRGDRVVSFCFVGIVGRTPEKRELERAFWDAGLCVLVCL